MDSDESDTFVFILVDELDVLWDSSHARPAPSGPKVEYDHFAFELSKWRGFPFPFRNRDLLCGFAFEVAKLLESLTITHIPFFWKGVLE